MADFVAVKTCKTCATELPLDAYWKMTASPDGLQRSCKHCQGESGRNRWRSYHLRETYGITEEEYDQMLEDQGGGCAICKSSPGLRRLAVDHNHVTGKVRGLLCFDCNTGIGKFQEDINMLIEAAAYMAEKEGQ